MSEPGPESLGTMTGDLSQLAAEHMPCGVLIAGPDGIITFVNHRLEQAFGYPPQELIGQSVDVLLPDALGEVHEAHRQGFMARPEARPMGACRALFGRRKDGSEFPVEVGLQPIRTERAGQVLAMVIDAGERRRLEKTHQDALEDAAQFDHLVGEISASFVNVRAEQIDEAIQDGQRRILEALDLDRSAVFQVSEAGHAVRTHAWSRPGIQAPPSGVSAGSAFPWSLTRALAGEISCVSSIDEVPDAVERESLRFYDFNSFVVLPFSIGGRTEGVLAFTSSREGVEWKPEIVARMRLVAEVFGSALALRQADIALRESEQRFHTLADNAPTLIWTSGADKLCTWFNRGWLDFVGRTMEQELGNGWAEGVHPDDFDSCLETYRKSFDAREPFSMEYRLRRHDGEWRWILDNGTPNHTADGEFAGYLGSCVDVTERKKAHQKVERSRDQLRAENAYLRIEVQDHIGNGVIIGHTEGIRHVLSQIEHVAATDSTVLLLGETGTGKELFATQIHELSARHGRPMVRVNCSAIPATLIESELFGREKGAFTGALAMQVGRFELANHSTIFLDEIGDLPADVQVKLLRVLEQRQIERLGSPKPIHVDTRIVAATHRNLEQRVAAELFREDLFYRLNVFPIQVPPLRERVEDIPLLVWRFVDEFSKAFGKRIDSISRQNMAVLQQYGWPGNIRELRNLVERAMIVATSSQLTITVPSPRAAGGRRSTKLADVEKEHIHNVLESSKWRIRGAGGAAERLGLQPTTLETRMVKLGLTRPKK